MAHQSLAHTNKDQIIDRMRQGHRLVDIAKDMGFSSHASISMRLKDDPDYQAAKLDSLAQVLDQRERELEAATDNVTLTRADRLLNHARWRAEREGAAIWGARQETTITHRGLDLDGALASARAALSGRVIDVPHTTSSDDTGEDSQD